MLARDVQEAQLDLGVVGTEKVHEPRAEGRAARYPQNAAYILRNNGPARMGLRLFATIPRDQVAAALLAACNME